MKRMLPCVIGLSAGVALMAIVACSVATPPSASPAAAPQGQSVSAASALPSLDPHIPFDVSVPPSPPAPPPTLDSLQHDFDELSWQTFVAMNWPVLPNGQPDPSRKPGQNGDNDAVWEDWRDAPSIFLPNGAPPAPWGTPPPPPAMLPAAARRLLGPGVLFLTQIGKTPGLLTDAVQPFNTGPLIDQNGRYARFEILVNRSMFETIFHQQLYNKQAQHGVTNVVFDCGSAASKDVGAIMVKAAWKILSPAEVASGRFHVAQALIYTPATANPKIEEKYERATVGLVGLHVVHKTADAPQWIWTTFEQVDNCPTAGVPITQSHFNFYNPREPTAPVNTPPARPWNPTLTEPPSRRPQIRREIPIDAPTQQLNATWQAALRAVNPRSVWQYYELVSTQWPTQPAPQCDVATSAPANMSGAPAPQFLGNSTLESYIQGHTPNVSSSCIECHLNATTTASAFSDFTYLLERAQ